MSEQGQGQQQYLAPPPFVTHEQMGGVHSRLGALEQGHAGLTAMFGHYRGEMLGQFDLTRAANKRMDEKLEQIAAAISNVPQRQPEQGGLNLSVREAFIACFAIMAGTALITNMATTQKPPVETVRRALDMVP